MVCFLTVKTLSQTGFSSDHREFNGAYRGEYLNRIAFPVGGIGAGMFCIEGTGTISHMSVRNYPDIFNEPCMFAAISVKGLPEGSKVLEGPVPDWKKFGLQQSGKGAPRTTWGLPHFDEAEFITRFPFCEIKLKDKEIPLEVVITGWSPFIPTDEDNSSLPVGAIEYYFKNTSSRSIDLVFSYNSKNFMKQSGSERNTVKAFKKGFVLSQEGSEKEPEKQGDFAIFTDDPQTVVDNCWYRGEWWNGMTIVWETIKEGRLRITPPVEAEAPGASLFVPFSLKAGEEKTVRLMMSWYVPNSRLHIGTEPTDKKNITVNANVDNYSSPYFKPWYSGKFKTVEEVAAYWKLNYDDLKLKTTLFSNAFYNSTLPPEVIEAVAANLTILKSPTVLRQVDGRLWGWEGCDDSWGYCPGSCTHVWNYAQAIAHLFPSLERSLRNTEFGESQDAEGHQMFRSSLPIRPLSHDFFAASDGQLGGIMKVYRDWRISGDNEWLKKIYPKVKASMDYCIKTWDPRKKGIIEEPHLNTYDIEFWGPDGMNTSLYLGALNAINKIGQFVGDSVNAYQILYDKGKQFMEKELYDGEYFIQKVRWTGLKTPDPVELSKSSRSGGNSEDNIELWQREGPNSEEDLALLQKEGPKYQYGSGCLSDGVLGSWISRVCGLADPIDNEKIKSHLLSVYKYNLKHDLSDHANQQRAGFAMGHEGGLLVCTWPKGGQPSLPVIYCNEVWTGIEYQVASHLMFMGEVEKGLNIVRTCRNRYDGRIRNPFDEYEAGHWYARAMSSYALLEGLTGVRYDAVEHTLYIDSKIGDFVSFLSTETGFGNVGLKSGKPFVKMVYGDISIKKVIVSGVQKKLD
jgi:uncharacterized protein (DUF608 family)